MKLADFCPGVPDFWSLPHLDQFDIHRNASARMVFGHGIHFCIGKGLLLAFDFVESKQSRTPSPLANHFYLNALRRGVVVSGGASSDVRVNRW